jgi:two-component system, NarL family, response regulator DegU
MSKELVNIFIADDHDLIRQGLKRIISFEEDMVIVGEAENGEKALKMIKENTPDVLILDFNMPILDGIEVLKIVKEQNSPIKVIILTIENNNKIIHEAINIGADGYLLKDSAGTEIVNAIRTVCAGEKFIDKSLISALFSGIRNENAKANNILDVLSNRELEVLLKISNGFSNKEIGEQLFLSDKTVRNYATNLFRKINAHDRVQATIIAYECCLKDYYNSKFKVY